MFLTPLYNSILEERKKKKILAKFEQNEIFQQYLPKKSATLNPENRMKFELNESLLSIVVGESGVGKTTEICNYAQQLREKEYPVIYFSIPKNSGYKLENVLNLIFGTSDEELINRTIEENYTKKDKVPTLILDNIHYAMIDGKVDEGLLNFLNVNLYQGLKMAIIMLSSVNRVAYEIQKCNVIFFLFFFFNYLGSGYRHRCDIIEIEPYSKQFIKQFLKTHTLLKEDAEFEKYISLFDGNLKSILKFSTSHQTLDGIFIFVLLKTNFLSRVD